MCVRAFPATLTPAGHVGPTVFSEPAGETELFPYSPALTDVADRIADKMRPFAAVHWRLEAVGVAEPDFVGCAEDALDKLSAVSNLTTLWVMTDYRAHRPKRSD